MGKGVLLMSIEEVGETSVNFGSYSNKHKQILVEEVAWWLGWHKSFEASRISVYVFFFNKLTYFFLMSRVHYTGTTLKRIVLFHKRSVDL